LKYEFYLEILYADTLCLLYQFRFDTTTAQDKRVLNAHRKSQTPRAVIYNHI